MNEEHGQFCTVFDCMDGRTKALVLQWCRRNLNVEYPDTVTIAGCDGVLISNNVESARSKHMAEISVQKHGAKDAVVVGHTECAGNPVSSEEHCQNIKDSVTLVESWGMYGRVIGIFVNVSNRSVEEICRTGTIKEPVTA